MKSSQRGVFLTGKKSRIFDIALLYIILLCAILPGCEKTIEEKIASGEPITIRIAHNWPREMDTSFRDPITNLPYIGQEEMNARIYAEEQVLKKFNVKLQWIQYPSDLNEDILRSVLAADPLAEMVRVIEASQGRLLGQNVLQPLDDYEYLFRDEDSSWMYWGKVYGHNFFLNNVLRHGNDAPLCYNIGMLEKVPALKENGKTILPVDLWLEGRWTWSVFEDYLQKVHDYWIQEWANTAAFGADYRAAAQMAIHANGGYVYGDDGLGIDSPQAKEAVAYIERLMSKNLIRSLDIARNTSRMSHRSDLNRFSNGQSVFSNFQQWYAYAIATNFNNRNEAMGIVPFPRPDYMAPDDPRYQQLNDTKDCYAVPRGVSRELTELAVKAFREYTVAFYRHMAKSERALDFLQADGAARESAFAMFLDITNDEYGDKLLEAWKFLGSNENIITNEYAKNVGIYDTWSDQILGDSLYRVNGASQYAVQVEAKKGLITEILNTLARSLNSDELFDNIPPRLIDIEGVKMAFPAGTIPEDINWDKYTKIEDNVDGVIPFSEALIDLSAVNFTKPGLYTDGAVFSASDSSGNLGTAKRTITIYDGTNTTPPELVLKNEYRSVKLEEKTAGINWRVDFVQSAKDKDGLNIMDNLSFDLAEIDTTKPGKYNVGISVKDFAGNSSSAVLTVTVE